MLLLSLSHSEARESDQAVMFGMEDHQWIQVLARTGENLYFWVDLAFLTVVHCYMK